MQRKHVLLLGIVFLLLLMSLPLSSAAAVTRMQPVSSIYSGYEVTGPYTSLRVKGTWIVPTANCAQTPNSASNISVTFDAINGEGDGFMIGTYQDCKNGMPSYGAFLIVYPETGLFGNKSSIGSLVIHPGDQIEAQGTFRIGSKPANWNTNFVDLSTCTQVDTDARTTRGFLPKQDSGAVVLSSVHGMPLTSLTTIESGKLYATMKCKGLQGPLGSDMTGPEHESISFGKMGATTGYTLTLLQIRGTAVTKLTDRGTSFEIEGA